MTLYNPVEKLIKEIFIVDLRRVLGYFSGLMLAVRHILPALYRLFAGKAPKKFWVVRVAWRIDIIFV